MSVSIPKSSALLVAGSVGLNNSVKFNPKGCCVSLSKGCFPGSAALPISLRASTGLRFKNLSLKLYGLPSKVSSIPESILVLSKI